MFDARALTAGRLRGGSAAAATLLASLLAPRAGAAEAPGDQRRWALDFSARLEQAGGEGAVEIKLSGDWLSTLIEVRAGEYDAALELADVRVSGTGAVPADAAQRLATRLTRRFWATYRTDGTLVRVHFFTDVVASDRNLLQMLATETQFVRADANRPVWTTLERDGAGDYLAIYEPAGSNSILKRKLKYVDSDGAGGAPERVHVAVERSELRFALDAEAGVLGLDGTERMRIGLALGDAVQLGSVVETHLTNLRRGRAAELVGSLTRALPALTSSAITTQSPGLDLVRAQNDDWLLIGWTTESLLDAAVSGSDDALLPQRLSALFRGRPEAAGAALARLGKSGPRKLLTDALGVAASPSAIEALGELARDPALASSARVDAVTALLRAHRPGLDAMRIASALLDDADQPVRSAARLVSGALARAGRPEHPAEADMIDAALIARYRRADQVPELCDLMAALGNSIGAAVLPVIEQALADPRGPVRAAAARALRLYPGPEVDGLLSKAMTSDPDPSVRTNAIVAAQFRHPLSRPLAESLVRVARTDSVDSIRSRAIALLRQNPKASPRTAEALAWIADNDGNPGIRRLAREALTPP